MPNTNWTDRYAKTTDGGYLWRSSDTWSDLQLNGEVLKRDGWQSAIWVVLPTGNLLCAGNRENSLTQLVPKVRRTSDYSTRNLDEDFVISTEQDCRAVYTLDLVVNNDLVNVGTQSAKVELLVDGVSVSSVENTITATLSIGLSLVTTHQKTVSGFVPRGSTVYLRTTTQGSGTVTYVAGQEFLLEAEVKT